MPETTEDKEIQEIREDAEKIRLVDEAREYFRVPIGFGFFLYVLPAYYVALADGEISDEEGDSILNGGLGQVIMNSLPGAYKDQFYEWMAWVLPEVVLQRRPEDVGKLALVIDFELSQMVPTEADKKRKQMYDSCLQVAKASGPMFRSKVSAEEQEMLDMIFGDIGRSGNK